MEPQKYPEIRAGESGPTKRPYDIAGWTLRMQMGVRWTASTTPFELSWKWSATSSREPCSTIAQHVLPRPGGVAREREEGPVGAPTARSLPRRLRTSTRQRGRLRQPARRGL